MVALNSKPLQITIIPSDTVGEAVSGTNTLARIFHENER